MNHSNKGLTNSIRQVPQVPAVILPLCCGNNATCVLVRRVFVIAVAVPMHVSEMTSHSNQNCFRSTCIPALAASTCKNICMCLTFHEQHHLHIQPESFYLLCQKHIKQGHIEGSVYEKFY